MKSEVLYSLYCADQRVLNSYHLENMDFEGGKIAQAKTEHEILLEDEKSAKRKRSSDRRRRRKYKFSDKHHTKRGIIASLLIIPGLALIVISIILATKQKGQGGVIVGLLPFIALLTSTAGIILAAITFRKPDTIYTFSWIGLISNIVIWMFIASMTAAGL